MISTFRGYSSGKLGKVFDAFPGANIHEKIAAYVKSAGFTDADIERFRALMLEP